MHRLQREYPELLFELDQEKVWMGTLGHERSVAVALFDTWEAMTPEWHGHFDSRKKAFETALLILCGAARTANEFRGAKLAESWLEICDGDGYEVWHRAVYLNFFDRDEWNLWPGEKWRAMRIHRRLIAPPAGLNCTLPSEEFLPEIGSVGEFELTGDLPFRPPDESFLERWEREIGNPVGGLRWSNDYYWRLALQVPLGWRRELERDEEFDSVTFTPKDKNPFLRVLTSFRDAETPVSSKGLLPLTSIEHQFEAISSDAPDWSLHRWTLHFPGTEEDMKADIYLYQLIGEDVDTDWFEILNQTMTLARHIVS